MRKITFLMALLFLCFYSIRSSAQSVEASTAWFNGETFETSTLGSIYWSGTTPNGLINTNTKTSVTTSGNVLALSYPGATTVLTEGTSSQLFNTTNTFTTGLSGVIYAKLSAYHNTRGTGYVFKNTDGNTVFGFGSKDSNASNKSNLRYTLDGFVAGGGYLNGNPTLVEVTSLNWLRSQWYDWEMVIDLDAKKLISCKATKIGGSSITLATNLTLTNGGTINKLNIVTPAYGAAGLDNVTIGELLPNDISNLTGDVELQTINSTSVSKTYSLTATADVASLSLTDVVVKSGDIVWTVSNWGGLSESDQANVALTRSTSNHAEATLLTSDAISTDATITIQAEYGSITLTKNIDLKAASVAGLKNNLNTEIDNASTKKNNVTDSNPYITSAKSTLQTQMTAAQGVYDNVSATEGEINSAISDLQTAETNFDNAISPYNTYVTYIGTVTSGRDAEVRTEPFFTTIKAQLTTAIDAATSAKSTVSTSTDISDAQTSLQTAYNQFTTDITTFNNFNTQITSVGSRITAANLRKGDVRFLQFPSATVQTLSDAKTTAETARDNETTSNALNTSLTTLTAALTTFNSASRVGPGTGYYRIYTWGADNGDVSSTKSILFDSNGTLRYKANSTTLDANSIWKITETTTNKYTIQNTKTGNFISGTSVGASTEFSINEVKSQTGQITGPSEIFNIFSIINSSSKALEVDTYDGVSATGTFTINSGYADRYRFAYQFEPIATLPASLSANLSEATNWSSGSAPTTGDIAISGSLTADQDATSLNNINITTGGQLTINAGKKLTVTNGVFANNGTFSLASDETNGTATFVNPTLIVNSITATVNQYLTTGRNWYVASPISGATAANLLTGASKVYKYDEPTAAWVELVSTDALEAGKGYLTQANATGNVSFNGTLNDGAITVNLTRTSGANKAGFNLVGNPYPSYVNWDAVTKTNVDPTMYYRTKNGAGTYKFATYSATTQLGTNVNIGLAAEQHPADYVTGNIPPMQAFWVRVLPAVDGSSTTGSIAFANSARAHKGTQTQSGSVINDSKMRAPAAALQQVLRLAVSNGINADEAILLFNNNASDGLDAFDSYKMSNNTASIPEIYTRVNANDLVINGMNSYDYNTIVPLGFKAGETNNYTISASQMYNFDADTKIILKDDLTGIQTDLSAGESYSFSSDAINTTDRFSVLFKSAAGTTDLVNSRNGIKVYAVDNQIFVENQGFSKTTNAEVFNTLGQKMYSQSLNSDVNKINRDFSTGAYFVKINDGKQTAAYKLIIR